STAAMILSGSAVQIKGLGAGLVSAMKPLMAAWSSTRDRETARLRRRPSLIGSYFNIPVAYLPGQRVLAQQGVEFFGMRYVVPFAAPWPGTLIAVNVGGAVIPTMMSVYLLARNGLWVNAALATAAVAAVCYWLSRPMPGLGIAEPVFVPSVTTAIVALL